MIYARELTREQAISIVQESSGPVRCAVGKADGYTWPIQNLMTGHESLVHPFDLLKIALACLQTAGIPYTLKPREA